MNSCLLGLRLSKCPEMNSIWTAGGFLTVRWKPAFFRNLGNQFPIAKRSHVPYLWQKRHMAPLAYTCDCLSSKHTCFQALTVSQVLVLHFKVLVACHLLTSASALSALQLTGFCPSTIHPAMALFVLLSPAILYDLCPLCSPLFPLLLQMVLDMPSVLDIHVQSASFSLCSLLITIKTLTIQWNTHVSVLHC